MQKPNRRRQHILNILQKSKPSQMVVEKLLKVKEGEIRSFSVETTDGTVHQLKGAPVVRQGEILVTSK